ncbi:integrase, catalytic region, zinc finger, CCHC-type containing protein, partial [Tanacetum coccineum]
MSSMQKDIQCAGYSELTKDDRESQLYDEFEHFCQIKGETIHIYYVRFTKLINDMRNIKMTMPRMQLNSKFVNNMLPEWSRFITEVKLNRGLKESNFDQLYAYLKQHEVHANENRTMMALVSNASVHQYPTQSSKSPQPSNQPSPADNFQLDSGSSLTENLIESLTNSLSLLTQFLRSAELWFKMSVEDTNANNQGRPFQRNNARGNVVSRNVGGHIARECPRPKRLQDSDYFKDKMLLMQAQENGAVLDEEQTFDAFDFDIDEGPTTQTMFMANLTSEDPIYDEAGPSYDSNTPFEVRDRDIFVESSGSTGKKVALGKLNCGYQWRPTGKKFALGEMCPLTKLSVKCCSKHMTGNRSKLKNLMEKFIRIVRFGNDHFGAIMGYGDYVIGDSVILRVYYVKGLGHNLFSVGQFCDSDLEVAFRKHTCFVRDINGADLLKGSRSTNLYTISIDDMMKSSPICLLSKASKSKSWLWHRRLNHLNFGTINDLARQDLNRSLIHTHHNKTPYELVHDKKPDLTFLRVFGALCYPTNDSENLGKFQAKADIGIFVGYSPSRKGYRIYNKRTRRLMETIHVTFDEMHQSMAHVRIMSPGQLDEMHQSMHQSMAQSMHQSMHQSMAHSMRIYNKRPEPFIMSHGQLKSGLAPTDKELEMLFQPMFDEHLEQSRVNEPVPSATEINAQVVPP